MRENMTNSEQLKWVIQETGRQIAAAPIKVWDFVVESVNAPFVLVHEIEYKLAVRKLQSQRFRNLLEGLTDNGLIDRMFNTTEIAVQGDDKAHAVPVRRVMPKLKLIQDIR